MYYVTFVVACDSAPGTLTAPRLAAESGGGPRAPLPRGRSGPGVALGVRPQLPGTNATRIVLSKPFFWIRHKYTSTLNNNNYSGLVRQLGAHAVLGLPKAALCESHI